MNLLLKLKPVLLVLALTLMLTLPARALLINVTYDISLASATNAPQIQTAFNAAAQTIQSLYTNNITINITMYWGAFGPFSGGVGFGSSNTKFVGTYTYATLTNALRLARTTLEDSNAVASLPPADPAPGGSWYVPRAQAKALGLISSDLVLDGSVGFGTNFNFTFDPTNRAVAGKYDFVALAERQITEVMGRVYIDLSANFVPYDLFRFTSNGVRSLSVNANGAYFSIDNGATPLRYFWTNASPGIVTDWLTAGPADCFDYQFSSGKKFVFSHADLIALDILGYRLNYTRPRLTGLPSGTNFVLSFTNLPGSTYTLLATTNINLPITNWPTLGIVTDTVPGQFQFTDTQAGSQELRVYRTRLN
jgi:hypothetical protein